VDKKRGAVLAVAAAVAVTACSGSAPQASPPPSPADPKVVTMLEGFASAIVARDYASAYNAVAVERRGELPLSELQENFGHYRDGLPDDLQAKVQVDPYDRETALLVPEELRDRIVAEGVIHFEPRAEGQEGFSATVWVMLDAGEPKLATFYVED
jgi:hypothetical protein